MGIDQSTLSKLTTYSEKAPWQSKSNWAGIVGALLFAGEAFRYWLAGTDVSWEGVAVRVGTGIAVALGSWGFRGIAGAILAALTAILKALLEAQQEKEAAAKKAGTGK